MAHNGGHPDRSVWGHPLLGTRAAATAGRAWRLAILRSRLPPSGATDQVPTFWLPHLVATVRVIRLQKGMCPLAVEFDIGTRKNSGRSGTRTGGTLTCASAGSSPSPGFGSNGGGVGARGPGFHPAVNGELTMPSI